jgi:hypothetical protein
MRRAPGVGSPMVVWRGRWCRTLPARSPRGRLRRLSLVVVVFVIVVCVAILVVVWFVVHIDAHARYEVTEASRALLKTTFAVMSATGGRAAHLAGPVDEAAGVESLIAPSNRFDELSTDRDRIRSAADICLRFVVAERAQSHEEPSFEFFCADPRFR